MRVVLPSPDSPAAIHGRKRWTPSVHEDIILTDDHNCEVGAAFGDNSVPLRKRTREGRRRRTQRRGQTWLGKFAIPIPLDISANEIRKCYEVKRVETWNRTTQSYLCSPASNRLHPNPTKTDCQNSTLFTRIYNHTKI